MQRNVTIADNKIDLHERILCSGSQNVCYEVDITFNFNEALSGGIINGFIYDDDATECQGDVQGTFSNSTRLISDKIGVFRPSIGMWFLDSSGNGAWNDCTSDTCINFGIQGDIPVTGDWNGDGTTKIGVFRPSIGWWFLDYNGNGQWDGCCNRPVLQLRHHRRHTGDRGLEWRRQDRDRSFPQEHRLVVPGLQRLTAPGAGVRRINAITSVFPKTRL